MSYCIGIEDLVSNGLMEKISRTGQRFISYEEINDYGTKIVKYLRDNGKEAYLSMNRYKTADFFYFNSDFFEEVAYHGENGVALKENKRLEELRDKYGGILALDVKLAFVSTPI